MAIDDNTLYGLKGSQLKDLSKKINAVKGVAKELTTDDYNWPVADPNGIAIWLLDEGEYKFADNITLYKNSFASETTNGTGIVVLSKPTTSHNGSIIISRNNVKPKIIYGISSEGTGGTIVDFPVTIENNLTSSSAGNALSAKQGKTLNEKIEGRVIQNAGAPTTSTVGTIGLLLEDTTNGKLYVCVDIDNTDTSNPVYTWKEVGSDTVKELTADDYNYPIDNPQYIALWLLDSGTYILNGAAFKSSTSSSLNTSESGLFIVGEMNNGTYEEVEIVGFYSSATSGLQEAFNAKTRVSNGLGLVYKNLMPPTVVQTTGTSTTDVMSQKAVSGVLFSGRYGNYTGIVRLVPNSTTGQYGSGVLSAVGIGVNVEVQANNGTAVGPGAATSGESAIALGSNAVATVKGQFDVSTGSQTTAGYNNSNYRLLTGLYDPQSDHDAATKGYVDTAVAGAGGGGVTVLTADDYNYPTDNPTKIAAWLLDDGLYEFESVIIANNTYYENGNLDPANTSSVVMFEVSSNATNGRKTMVGYYENNGIMLYPSFSMTVNASTGVKVTNGFYYNLSTHSVEQSTGTNTSRPMSQNATTSMIFADPTVTHRVRIASTQVVGDHSTTVGELAQGYGVGSTALGWGARVYGDGGVGIGREVDNVMTSYKGTVAIGSYSGMGITATGMMDIGTRDINYGYDSSNYRLLTGLYDPQNAHDAANKEYVDNAIAGVAYDPTISSHTLYL